MKPTPVPKTYTAEVSRSGRWWAIDVPGVPGVHTRARRLADVEDVARDAISGVLDVPMASIEITVVRVMRPSYEWVKRQALAELDRGYNLGGGTLPSRDELYDR